MNVFSRETFVPTSTSPLMDSVVAMKGNLRSVSEALMEVSVILVGIKWQPRLSAVIDLAVFMVSCATFNVVI